MRRRERQRLLFPLHWPKPRLAPKLDHGQATALIREEWARPDGTPITEAEADHRASVVLHHLRFEPGPLSRPPQPRKRPERPTADRIRAFIAIETDWIRK